MASLLLPIIYLAFISLGLPDALLGAAWPTMYPQLGAQVSWAGGVSMIISACTILSALASDRLNERLGTGRVTAISVATTAAALFGFSFCHAFWQLCLWAIPYGLGAGSVDAALNNYVALHYKSRHMSWLHCMWGVGASLGPVIMGQALAGSGWQGGYRIIGILQVVLTVVLLFSLPLMMTQVLEVLFNLSDVAIAGKFADYLALGAVGSTTLLVSLFTGLLIGIGSGVNVVVARGLGLGSHEDVEKTIHTSLLICSGIGIVVCLVCLLLAKPMLLLLNTKEELLPGAVGYLRIYALGMPAMAVYNFGNGVLSAAGDTKRPLLYLSIAGVVNVALNLFFVIQCHMAALGVATASAIAQWLSALLIMRHLMSQKDACGVHLKKLGIDKAAAKRVLMIGIPSGLQNAIFALANLFVQIGVNSFDSVMVSGSSAAANADTLIFNMMSAFYTGCATFVSRNWGAGKTDRILKSYRIVLLYSFLVGSICGGLLLLFGDKFLGLFANEADVIAAGMQRLKIMGFSFGVSALMDASIAASRGIGRSIVPTIIVIMGSCVFRVIWVYTVFAYFGTIPSLFLLYIFSWAITGIAEWAYFRHSYKKYILHGQIW